MRRPFVAIAPTRERGAGLIGTLAGFLVFMLLLLAAVQILYDLYATSVVTAAAYDSARLVAGYDSAADRCAATARAEREFRDQLGRYATVARPRLSWTCADPDVVRLLVVVDHPTALPPKLRGLTGLGHMERTIEVRVEDFR